MKAAVETQNLARAGQGRFYEDGFEIIPDVCSHECCDELAGTLSILHQRQEAKTQGKLGGLRNLLRVSQAVATLSRSVNLKSLLTNRMNKEVFPVRAIFFDKTASANWRVAWHQDVTIAVRKRIETPGFEAWSVKDGVAHVQPPCEILDGLATLRLHLDDCGRENGALKIVRASHLNGRLTPVQARELVQKNEVVTCEVSKGGVLLMRPLLLHSSSPSKNPSHRRILHIEYGSHELPNGLQWHDR